MHVTTLNTGDLFISLWRGTIGCDPSDDISTWDLSPFRDPILWKAHGKAVQIATPFIPSSFDRPPRNIAEKVNSGYRVIEWQGYLYGLGPALLHGILPDRYWKNFCLLVSAVRIIIQCSITREQIIQAQRSMEQFLVEFEEIYVQRRVDRLHFVQPVLHHLLHLGLEVPHMSPPGISAAWTMERTIGNLGEEIRLPSNPYKNLSERALRSTQLNVMKAHFPELVKDRNPEPQGSLAVGDDYLLLRKRDRYP
ncbi:hypothetical protein M422DRAFT_135788, partial [Sphaerobolus stellatus SS14]